MLLIKMFLLGLFLVSHAFAETCKTGLFVGQNDGATKLSVYVPQSNVRSFSCEISKPLFLCSEKNVVQTDLGYQIQIVPGKNEEFLNWLENEGSSCSFINAFAWKDMAMTFSAKNTKTFGPVEKVEVSSENRTIFRARPEATAALGWKIYQKALDWKDKYFRYLEEAQCAEFVREVLSKTCSPHFLSSSSRVIQSLMPWDYNILGRYASYAPSYADSLAGDELGERINKISDLKLGDIVFFNNTYGNWPWGVITHVGIYAGEQQMIDRPTFAAPVVLRKFGSGLFAGGLRLNPNLCQ